MERNGYEDLRVTGRGFAVIDHPKSLLLGVSQSCSKSGTVVSGMIRITTIEAKVILAATLSFLLSRDLHFIKFHWNGSLICRLGCLRRGS